MSDPSDVFFVLSAMFWFAMLIVAIVLFFISIIWPFLPVKRGNDE